jgi:hypothetical protein
MSQVKSDLLSMTPDYKVAVCIAFSNALSLAKETKPSLDSRVEENRLPVEKKTGKSARPRVVLLRIGGILGAIFIPSDIRLEQNKIFVSLFNTDS